MSGEHAAVDRLLDLLTDRATEGLDPVAGADLDLLLEDHPEFDPDALDLAAAQAHLAFLDEESAGLEAMPATARRRLEQAAAAFAANLAGAPDPARRLHPFGAAARRSAPPALAWAGWVTAAAVTVAFLLASRPASYPQPTAAYQAAGTAAERRQRLLAAESDAMMVAWAPPEAPGYEAVSGDVVWSSRSQAGYMRLKGLPVNTPGETQYQLWIVDPTRDEQPVDGGVFDVPAGLDEVVIPIDPKLAVGRPAAFAITREQPGGVVVSDGPLLVVAPVPGQGA